MLLRRYATRQFARWIGAVTGYVVLGPDVSVPRPDAPWVGLTMLAEPHQVARERNVVGGAVAWDLDLSGANGVDPVGFEVAGRVFDLPAAASVADVLTALDESDLTVDGWFAAVATGPNTLRITTAAGRAPPEVVAIQNVDVSVFATEDYTESRCTVNCVVRAECYGATRSEVDRLGELHTEVRHDKPELVTALGPATPMSVQVDARSEPRTYIDAVLTTENLKRWPLEALVGVDVGHE